MTQTYEGSADLALVEARPLTSATGVMPIVTPEEARAQMQAYTALVAAVIGDEDYQTFKERGKEKRFKKKSAVKKLQTYFGFTIEIVDAERDDLGDGHFGFRVKARAVSPNGRSVEALAGCSTTEERFDVTPNEWEQGEEDPKFLNRRRKTNARAYHDVLSTAETRATNRAAMNLIGAGEVTAEEISRPSQSSRPVARSQRDPDDLAAEYAATQARTRPAPRNAPESTRRPDATATDPAKGANSEHPGTGDRVVRPELNPAAGRAPEPAPLNAEADAKKRRALRTSIVVNSRVLWPDKAECETNRHLAERLHRVSGLGDDVIDSVPMEALESLQRDIARRSNGSAEATARSIERDEEDAMWDALDRAR